MKIIFIYILLVYSITLFAQEGQNEQNQQNGNIPRLVRLAFIQDHPQAHNVTWATANSIWHVNYNDHITNYWDDNWDNSWKGSKIVDIYYDLSGNIIETHTMVSDIEVPLVVEVKVNTKYGAEGNYHAVRIVRANNRPIYKITYRKKGKDRIIFLNEKGEKAHYNEWAV